MKIILATDGTKQCDEAVKMLRHFALSPSDELKLVSVIDMAVPTSLEIYGGYLPDTSEFERAARENASRILEETAGRVRTNFGDSAPTLTTEVLFGTPESRIVETAEAWQADLIIVGSHHHSRWERLLLGSVSDSVVHHAPCSVLVVRAATADGE
jgi:nucleotide-binding universal stress UspA family protein